MALAKKILVDLTQQKVTATEGKTVFLECNCVSGDSSHLTPKGHFTVINKVHPCSSKKYHAQMNYALFFKATGEALHQYHGPSPWFLLRFGRTIVNWVGSHGCVRLTEENARKLFRWAAIGTQIEVR